MVKKEAIKKNHTLKEDLQITWRTLRLVAKWAPKAVPVFFSLSLFEALLPFINVLFPAMIINELLAARDVGQLTFLVLMSIGLNLFMQLARTALTQSQHYQQALVVVRFNQAISLKSTTMDFLHAENPQTQELRQLFVEGHNSIGGPGAHMRELGQVLQSVIAMVVSFGIVLQLFLLPPVGGLTGIAGFVDSPLSGILLLCLMVVALLLTVLVMVRAGLLTYRMQEINVPVNRKGNYLTSNVFNDYRFGKDIRLYNISGMLMDEMESFISTVLKSFRHIMNTTVGLESLVKALATLVLGSIYLFVAMKAMIGTIGIGSIILYVGAISQFNAGISGVLARITNLRLRCLYAKAYQDYLELPQVKVRGSQPVPQAADGRHTFEFRNVSFAYPGAETMMLKELNMTVKAGERLAVVGMNGAGKTTFIKLLCRLYDPTEGTILLNGVDIREIEYQEYLELFSVVFQDFKLLSLPLSENVAASNEVDRARATMFLEQTGVAERIAQMPEGIDSYLFKHYETGGVEVSGGEAQKIGIARALYKDAPIVILDEPTAALDPISEYEIYSTFDTLVGEKTAVYISHRLSSCRFCHDIAVFHEGRLIQRGNHEALLAEKGGKYAEMWQAQAQYYIEDTKSAASC